LVQSRNGPFLRFRRVTILYENDCKSYDRLYKHRTISNEFSVKHVFGANMSHPISFHSPVARGLRNPQPLKSEASRAAGSRRSRWGWIGLVGLSMALLAASCTTRSRHANAGPEDDSELALGPGSTTARVELSEGMAEFRTLTNSWARLKHGDIIMARSSIRTQSGAKLRLLFEGNESTLTLEEGTLWR